MIDKETISESHSSTDSYYHCKDIRYPVCNLTLPELYERHKTLDTDKGVTWHLPSYRLTYKLIYEQAQTIARGLLALGLKEGDVVLSVGSQCPDSLLMFVAGSLIGVIFFAGYLSEPFEMNIKYRIQKLKPKAIILGSSGTGYDIKEAASSVFKVLADLGEEQDYVQIFTDRAYEDWEEYTKRFTSKCAEGCMPFTRLTELSSKVSEQQLKDTMATMSSTQPCLIISSSGTTGEPKLIVHSARFLTNCCNAALERGTRSKDTRYGINDMCIEETALLDSVASGFYIGHETVVLPRLKTWEMDELRISFLEAMQEHRTSICYGDQSVLCSIVNNPSCMEGYDLSNMTALELGNTGASPTFKANLLQYFPNSMDTYGMSECWYVSSPSLGEMNYNKKVKSVGRTMVNSEMKIVDENGNCVPRNTEGEVWIRSCLNMIGYWEQPELTKRTVTQDGWLKTGDCGIMDEDNDLQLVGRMTDSERFKVYGDVVYAQAVEFVMKLMTEIDTVIVVGREQWNGDGCELTYCVQLKNDQTLSAEQIFEYAKDNLYSHLMWPIRVMFFDKFPRTGGRNKISRKDVLHEVEKKVEEDINFCIVNPDYLT